MAKRIANAVLSVILFTSILALPLGDLLTLALPETPDERAVFVASYGLLAVLLGFALRSAFRAIAPRRTPAPQSSRDTDSSPLDLSPTQPLH